MSRTACTCVPAIRGHSPQVVPPCRPKAIIGAVSKGFRGAPDLWAQTVQIPTGRRRTSRFGGRGAAVRSRLRRNHGSGEYGRLAIALMSRLAVLAVPFFAALLTTLLMVPPVMRFAISKHWLDEPDGVRRGHSRPVPRLGGVGIFAGVILAFGTAPIVGLLFDFAPTTPHISSATALLAASAILFFIGL